MKQYKYISKQGVGDGSDAIIYHKEVEFSYLENEAGLWLYDSENKQIIGLLEGKCSEYEMVLVQ